jgi:isochorismate synthase
VSANLDGMLPGGSSAAGSGVRELEGSEKALERQLGQALQDLGILHDRARSARDNQLLQVHVPAPVTSPLGLLSTFAGEDAVVFSPAVFSRAEGSRAESLRADSEAGRDRDGWGAPLSFAAVGRVCTLEASGSGRFQEIREQAAAVFSKLLFTPYRSAPLLARPRVFGGFAFGHAAPAAPPWRDFGACRFVLPRLTYASDGLRAVLSFTMLAGPSAPTLDDVESLRLALRTLHRPNAMRSSAEPVVRELERPARAAFDRVTAPLLAAIEQGAVHKVVVAQEVQLTTSTDLDPVETLRVLGTQAPDCTRFLVRTGGASFLGATPERLVSKRGRAVRTEALAGTIPADAPDAGERLLASAKNRAEHAWVRQALEQSLQSLGCTPRVEAQPQLRRLRHLLHLRTPIQAELSQDRHVLDVVERLHPTPAVGGFPSAGALSLIAAHEGFDRGWYSGVVGHLDHEGDGDFNVALRSGVLRGDRAWLYAGAGLVSGSNTAEEYDEISLKLTALRSAVRASR